jgi:cardiolipin synthase A/B
MDWFTYIGIAFIIWLTLVTLFTPAIPYHVETTVDPRSDQFIHVLESACQTTLEPGNKVDIFTDGPAFYPAMIEAIRAATETVNMECYIFKSGEVADQFIAVLSERARAGVRVTLVMDAIGSLGAFTATAAALREAGCRVEPYQQLHWYRLARLNNRTHRELVVVDGRVAFVGGAGVADWWWKAGSRGPIWRDMMARIEGPVVSDIQGILAENWLECCGEILTGPESYKPHDPVGDSPAFAIRSSPSDRATASRVLFQTLIECAREEVVIATPYFLPDRAFRRALRRTADRGVKIRVLVPGRITDQRWVRLASRRLYGALIRHRLRLFEYGEGMTHQKVLLVDGLWAVIGTTNLDNRSFEHNDEINVAIRDERITARLLEDFEADLSRSREVTFEMWDDRPLWEKLVGTVAWILERQQ